MRVYAGVPEGVSMKLDVGCGIYKKDGYTGVDVDPNVNPDIVAPMWSIPLPDNSVDELRSSHALEHVTRHQVVDVLKEWKRLLKPFAMAEIEVPDLRWCCQNWLHRQSADWHMDTIFGQATSIGEEHRTGFTPAIMADYIQRSGLELVSQTTIDSHGQPTLVFVVRKSI